MICRACKPWCIAPQSFFDSSLHNPEFPHRKLLKLNGNTGRKLTKRIALVFHGAK